MISKAATNRYSVPRQKALIQSLDKKAFIPGQKGIPQMTILYGPI